MASGDFSLELTEAGSWESFPSFAKKFVAQIGAKIIKKIDGPDIRIWEIEYEGVVLNFVYDDFPNGVSIEPRGKEGQPAIEKLFRHVSEQSDPDGL
ncbi:DUF3630 family protein [Marinobacter salinisoli]|uniref:DUF3630 family protein n=1 Tax=Marinobacter salinisoli TaxID=2769486 RepID=A0ABX7MS23_9GAMM|nr:DUF3630 family protein [Marinobacter salinisoli]QSP94184.1 DUF3630 family protein [Marinobacter salinisoli]